MYDSFFFSYDVVLVLRNWSGQQQPVPRALTFHMLEKCQNVCVCECVRAADCSAHCGVTWNWV